MALPGIQVVLRRSTVAPNPQDLAAIPLVIGPSSKGTVNVPQTFMSLADVDSGAGAGPGAEVAGEILSAAGGPVYFVPSNKDVAGTVGSVTKTDPAGAVGTPFTLYGGVIIPGADKDGRVFIRAKDDGVTVTVVQGNDGDTLLASVVGKDITIRLAAAMGAVTTTGTQLAAYVLPMAVAALIEQPVKYGTGASLVAVMAKTPLDGKLVFTPKVQNVKLKFLTYSGLSTPLAAAVANGTEITVTPGTGLDSQPTLAVDSATQVKNAVDAVASALVTVTVGTGGSMSGLGAAENGAAFHSLVFGSTGAMSVSGTPNDVYAVSCVVARGGTVGVDTLTMKWTADGVLFSGEVLIPPSGLVALKDTFLDTGLSVQFTNVLAVGDTFSFTTTRPTSSVASISSALAVALKDATRKFGYVTSSESLTKANIVVLESQLQAVWQSKFCAGLFSVRDIAEGVPGETEQQWMDAISADFAGFVSGPNANTDAGGLLAIVAAPVLHQSPLSLRQFRRNGTWAAAARKSSVPVHCDLGATKNGPLHGILAIYHDEAVRPGLKDQRFITTRTYDARPGQLYITSSPTMADASNVAYALLEWVAVALSVARIAKESAFPFINDSLQAIGAPDPGTGAPAGALALIEAQNIESITSSPIEKFLFRVKTDGKVSASPYPAGTRPVTVTRANNFLVDRTVNMEVAWVPLGLAETIKIGVQSKIGE